ncbi:uncharacterized protein LOC115621988 [Scaptodrosophila lebanonensis]|uniref:Uncharacterized protein LOC115621988 n=1 Tax=Drosophila lebanonensis TaxID=7225 RepID=A0A6J2T459_DROLE|nr:uncharacterized protein LOC115621988 [Scaptodrosophila lebanonensis]
MWEKQVFVLIAFLLILQVGNNNAQQQFNRFNSGTSGALTSATTTNHQLKRGSISSHKGQAEHLELELDTWQPLTQHNNWFILRATAASGSNSLQQRQLKKQQSQPQQQQQQEQRLPVNYYAHNHRYNQSNAGDGNYKQVRATESYDEPNNYVLAISQAMRRGEMLTHRQLPPLQNRQQQQKQTQRHWLPDEAYVHSQAEPEARDVADAAPAMPLMADGPVSDATAATKAIDTTAAQDADTDSEAEAEADEATLALDAYLAPFERALVKVRNFCDIVSNIISDEDDNNNEEWEQHHLQTTATPSRTTTGVDPNKLAHTTSKEVQGRQSRVHAVLMSGPFSTSTSSSNNAHGRAIVSTSRKLKKLKKKLQKLLLPLLIAYKLKFLTLIPVLIGGLTLLVGTTGLAGFFFALFTAVMSLKSATGHRSKSLVLKKI